ncbi:hypothetical protein CC2G_004126 [Coprinopsis cinerea AmutBmut pab1-1]|nr:hypothetical protein CC2G_004126 [Coprinopsis cinerea AmutBmut pab1-1]
MPALTLSPSTSSCSYDVPPMKDTTFAFARVKGETRLVQISCTAPMSPFMPVEVNLFRHEFVTIFRFDQSTIVHPSDFSIIECIDDSRIRYEEENETVFLAKDLMERLRELTTDPSKLAFQTRQRYPLQKRYRQR